jgi:uncharacterized protein YneF (UPF0154 family)
MTSPVAEPVSATPEKPAALWEDFMDIFYAPTQVFRRREDANPWPVILIITVLLVIIGFATYGAMAPAIEAVVRAQLAKNPQVTEDTVNTAVKFSSWSTRLGPIFYPIFILIAAVAVWVLARIVSAKPSFQKALVIVAYASIIDVAKAIITGVLAMAMGPDRLTSIYKLSLGPAALVDPTTASPILLAVFSRLDLFAIWYTALLGVGVYVIGRVSKSSAATFAVIYWIVLTLFTLIGPAVQAAKG